MNKANLPLRLISRLDIKSENLIKTIQLEGLKVLGNPNEFAVKYFNEGIDEIIYMDTVASLYGRNHLSNLIISSTKNIFVPITVGGGIRSIDDAFEILRSGADKVAINTQAVKNPQLIKQIADTFGSQCMVLSVEAKRVNNDWEVLVQGGREKTEISVLDWVKKGIDFGAGEILLTSVDREGTGRGFDLNLLSEVSKVSSVPVIASGGMNCLDHFVEVSRIDNIDAIAMAKVLHFNELQIQEIKNFAQENNIYVRI